MGSKITTTNTNQDHTANPNRYVSTTEHTVDTNENGVITLKSHKDAIFSIAILPDDRIVSGSRDYSIKIWKKKDQENSWECTHSMDGHRGSVTSLSVYPPSFVISGSLDSTLRVWNADSGIEVFKADCGASIYSLCTFKTNEEFASGLDNGTLKIWSGQPPDITNKITFKAHDDGVRCILEISENTIATGSYDFSIKLWDKSSGDCLAILKGHTDAILCMDLLSPGKLVSGGLTKDSTIRIWDLESKECVEWWKAHEDGVMSFCILPERGLVSSSMDKKIKMWNVDEKNCIKTLEGHKHFIYAIKLLSDGSIVSGCEDTTVKIWPSQLLSL